MTIHIIPQVTYEMLTPKAPHYFELCGEDLGLRPGTYPAELKVAGVGNGLALIATLMLGGACRYAQANGCVVVDVLEAI